MKALERRQTAADIASGKITAEEAQQRAAPIVGEVKIIDLWGSLRRYFAAHEKKKKRNS